jgi:hypothetical protein
LTATNNTKINCFSGFFCALCEFFALSAFKRIFSLAAKPIETGYKNSMIAKWPKTKLFSHALNAAAVHPNGWASAPVAGLGTR